MYANIVKFLIMKPKLYKNIIYNVHISNVVLKPKYCI